MAYDINTYKATLDSYLTSGVKHLRYVRKSLGKACIYYPIINDAQIKSYRTDQIFKEGRTTYYNNSMPYSEWDWFKSAYVIQGLDELDTSVKADYFVLIVGTMAALVKLTSNNYETERSISFCANIHEIVEKEKPKPKFFLLHACTVPFFVP